MNSSLVTQVLLDGLLLVDCLVERSTSSSRKFQSLLSLYYPLLSLMLCDLLKYFYP